MILKQWHSFCLCAEDNTLFPQDARPCGAAFAPLVFLVRRVPLCSRGLFYIHDLAELSEPETVRCLTPCSPASGELAGFVRAHGAGALNVCFQNAFAVLEAWQRPKRTGLVLTLVGLGDVGGTALLALKLLGHEFSRIQIFDPNKAQCARYELELRSIEGVGLENYTLAEDVDAESLAAVMELAVPGVVVENGTVREYNTTYAAHILGYIGPIWSEEAAEYREKGYSMNALVGKSGVEQAFEEYLHGSSGIKRTTVSSTGEILNRYYVTEPVPGNNVELTIDISLQAVAEQALEKVILDLRENGVGRNKEGKDARGGAVVVQMCKTGEILAMASYPTYDLATRAENAVALNEDETAPMFNRALAAYPPGSVYKMVTAIAAVDMGGFDPGYIIEDKGLYTFYESFQPKCHIWSLANPRTHGKINLMEAIAYSCNYYFYEVGRLTYDSYKKETGNNPFDIVAKALGLGEPTGIELPEDTGARANAEEKNNQYAGEDAGWFGADVLQAVIGQSLNKFTPLQLACYASALANKGTRYEATLLSRVVSWDYQDLIEESKPVVASTLEISEKALNALDQGMRMTASIGTAEQYLRDYPIPIACKTGTAQWQGTTSTGSFSGSDHASFVLYAPADNPEIAISVYVERGSQGGNLANVCIPILDAYFSSSAKYETVATENIAY